MYKATVRWMIRRNIARLNAGDYGPALAMYTDDATLTFPGSNSWSTMFRPARAAAGPPTRPIAGATRSRTFMRRYTAHGIQMVVDDILVNGPPWHARAAVRCHDWIPADGGHDVYDNRAVMWVRTRWGHIVEHEDYEDTERTLAYDELLGSTRAPRGTVLRWAHDRHRRSSASSMPSDETSTGHSPRSRPVASARTGSGTCSRRSSGSAPARPRGATRSPRWPRRRPTSPNRCSAGTTGGRSPPSSPRSTRGGQSLDDVFGWPDDVKTVSSLTLFAGVAAPTTR